MKGMEKEVFSWLYWQLTSILNDFEHMGKENENLEPRIFNEYYTQGIFAPETFDR
jgi:hypothetical protein